MAIFWGGGWAQACAQTPRPPLQVRADRTPKMVVAELSSRSQSDDLGPGPGPGALGWAWVSWPWARLGRVRRWGHGTMDLEGV